jgi:MATE family multidrug resistance protein
MLQVSQTSSKGLAKEATGLLRFAAPTILSQLGTMMLGVVDTIMVGHVNADAMAAAALGNSFVMGTLIVGHGIVLGVDPIATQAHGANDGERLARALQHAIFVGLLASLPIAFLWLFTEDVLGLFGQNPALAAEAHRYALAQLPGIPAYLVYAALQQYLRARGHLWPTFLVVVAGNGVNAFLNWVLIFGKLGAPELGIVGAALATGFTRIFLAVSLAIWIRVARFHAGAWVPWDRRSFDRAGLREIVRYGWPSALHLGLEFWAFALSTLLAGGLGTMELSGHSIVLNLASLAFMVPLGLSIAVTTRVGNLIGAGDSLGAQRAAHVALGLVALLMLAIALAFVVGRELLPTAYTDEGGVIACATAVLPIAAAFQLFDGLQVVGGGILRAMGRPRATAVFNFFGYYILGVPLGYALAYHTSEGLGGIWWGLCLGLAVVAVSLVLWIRARGPATVAPIVERAEPLAEP